MTGSLRRIPLKRAVFVQDFIFLREPECTVDFLTSPFICFHFSGLVLPPATLLSIPPLPTYSSQDFLFRHQVPVSCTFGFSVGFLWLSGAMPSLAGNVTCTCVLDLSSDILARQACQSTPADLFSGSRSRLPPPRQAFYFGFV
jgi:hypothetical protein